jgi:hypothetical protein
MLLGIAAAVGERILFPFSFLVIFYRGGFYTLLWVYIGIYLWYGLYLGRAKAAEFGAEKLSEWWPCR